MRVKIEMLEFLSSAEVNTRFSAGHEILQFCKCNNLKGGHLNSLWIKCSVDIADGYLSAIRLVVRAGVSAAEVGSLQASLQEQNTDTGKG